MKMPPKKILLLLLCFLAVQAAWGQNYTWTGSGGDTNWTTVGNWNYFDGSNTNSATTYPGDTSGGGWTHAPVYLSGSSIITADIDLDDQPLILNGGGELDIAIYTFKATYIYNGSGSIASNGGTVIATGYYTSGSDKISIGAAGISGNGITLKADKNITISAALDIYGNITFDSYAHAQGGTGPIGAIDFKTEPTSNVTVAVNSSCASFDFEAKSNGSNDGYVIFAKGFSSNGITKITSELSKYVKIDSNNVSYSSNGDFTVSAKGNIEIGQTNDTTIEQTGTLALKSDGAITVGSASYYATIGGSITLAAVATSGTPSIGAISFYAAPSANITLAVNNNCASFNLETATGSGDKNIALTNGFKATSGNIMIQCKGTAEQVTLDGGTISVYETATDKVIAVVATGGVTIGSGSTKPKMIAKEVNFGSQGNILVTKIEELTAEKLEFGSTSSPGSLASVTCTIGKILSNLNVDIEHSSTCTGAFSFTADANGKNITFTAGFSASAITINCSDSNGSPGTLTLAKGSEDTYTATTGDISVTSGGAIVIGASGNEVKLEAVSQAVVLKAGNGQKIELTLSDLKTSSISFNSGGTLGQIKCVITGISVSAIGVSVLTNCTEFDFSDSGSTSYTMTFTKAFAATAGKISINCSASSFGERNIILSDSATNKEYEAKGSGGFTITTTGYINASGGTSVGIKSSNGDISLTSGNGKYITVKDVLTETPSQSGKIDINCGSSTYGDLTLQGKVSTGKSSSFATQGSITITCDDMTMENGSSISSDYTPGVITITATGKVDIQGTATAERISAKSNTYSSTSPLIKISAAGDITVVDTSVDNAISTVGSAAGKVELVSTGGSITLGAVKTSQNDVTITSVATKTVTLNRGIDTTDATATTGSTGDVTITAETLNMSSTASISAAKDVDITNPMTKTVTMDADASIFSKGGKIEIKANATGGTATLGILKTVKASANVVNAEGDIIVEAKGDITLLGAITTGIDASNKSTKGSISIKSTEGNIVTTGLASDITISTEHSTVGKITLEVASSGTPSITLGETSKAVNISASQAGGNTAANGAITFTGAATLTVAGYIYTAQRSGGAYDDSFTLNGIGDVTIGGIYTAHPTNTSYKAGKGNVSITSTGVIDVGVIHTKGTGEGEVTLNNSGTSGKNIVISGAIDTTGITFTGAETKGKVSIDSKGAVSMTSTSKIEASNTVTVTLYGTDASADFASDSEIKVVQGSIEITSANNGSDAVGSVVLGKLTAASGNTTGYIAVTPNGEITLNGAVSTAGATAGFIKIDNAVNGSTSGIKINAPITAEGTYGASFGEVNIASNGTIKIANSTTPSPATTGAITAVKNVTITSAYASNALDFDTNSSVTSSNGDISITGSVDDGTVKVGKVYTNVSGNTSGNITVEAKGAITLGGEVKTSGATSGKVTIDNHGANSAKNITISGAIDTTGVTGSSGDEGKVTIKTAGQAKITSSGKIDSSNDVTVTLYDTGASADFDSTTPTTSYINVVQGDIFIKSNSTDAVGEVKLGKLNTAQTIANTKGNIEITPNGVITLNGEVTTVDTSKSSTVGYVKIDNSTNGASAININAAIKAGGTGFGSSPSVGVAIKSEGTITLASAGSVTAQKNVTIESSSATTAVTSGSTNSVTSSNGDITIKGSTDSGTVKVGKVYTNVSGNTSGNITVEAKGAITLDGEITSGISGSTGYVNIDNSASGSAATITIKAAITTTGASQGASYGQVNIASNGTITLDSAGAIAAQKNVTIESSASSDTAITSSVAANSVTSSDGDITITGSGVDGTVTVGALKTANSSASNYSGNIVITAKGAIALLGAITTGEGSVKQANEGNITIVTDKKIVNNYSVNIFSKFAGEGNITMLAKDAAGIVITAAISTEGAGANNAGGDVNLNGWHTTDNDSPRKVDFTGSISTKNAQSGNVNIDSYNEIKLTASSATTPVITTGGTGSGSGDITLNGNSGMTAASLSVIAITGVVSTAGATSGNIKLVSYAQPVSVTGSLATSEGTNYAGSGNVDITTQTSSITVTGSITTSGSGTNTSGGDVTLAYNGTTGSGLITVTGDIVTGGANTGAAAKSGKVTIEDNNEASGGSPITVGTSGQNNKISTTFAGVGSVSITTKTSSITVYGDITTSGAVNATTGGDITLKNTTASAGAITVTGNIVTGDPNNANAVNAAKSGNIVIESISSSANITLGTTNANNTVSAAYAGSGNITIGGSVSVAMVGTIDIKGSVTTSQAGTGGAVTLQKAGSLEVGGSIATAQKSGANGSLAITGIGSDVKIVNMIATADPNITANKSDTGDVSITDIGGVIEVGGIYTKGTGSGIVTLNNRVASGKHIKISGIIDTTEVTGSSGDEGKVIIETNGEVIISHQSTPIPATTGEIKAKSDVTIKSTTTTSTAMNFDADSSITSSAGDIKIENVAASGTGTMKLGKLLTNVSGNTSGNITVTAKGTVTLAGSEIKTEGATKGNISITTPGDVVTTGNPTNGFEISTGGNSTVGDITITAGGKVALGSTSYRVTVSTAGATSGNVQIVAKGTASMDGVDIKGTISTAGATSGNVNIVAKGTAGIAIVGDSTNGAIKTDSAGASSAGGDIKLNAYLNSSGDPLHNLTPQKVSVTGGVISTERAKSGDIVINSVTSGITTAGITTKSAGSGNIKIGGTSGSAMAGAIIINGDVSSSQAGPNSGSTGGAIRLEYAASLTVTGSIATAQKSGADGSLTIGNITDDITTGNIATAENANVSGVGDVSITSTAGAITVGAIYTKGTGSGKVTLTNAGSSAKSITLKGAITTEGVTSSTITDAGDISITATDDINTTGLPAGGFTISSENAAKSGKITMDAGAGITLGETGKAVSISAKNAGIGDVSLTAVNGITVYGDIGTAQNNGSNATGNLTIKSTASGDIEIKGDMTTGGAAAANASKEGNVTITGHGAVTVGKIITAYSGSGMVTIGGSSTTVTNVKMNNLIDTTGVTGASTTHEGKVTISALGKVAMMNDNSSTFAQIKASNDVTISSESSSAITEAMDFDADSAIDVYKGDISIKRTNGTGGTMALGKLHTAFASPVAANTNTRGSITVDAKGAITLKGEIVTGLANDRKSNVGDIEIKTTTGDISTSNAFDIHSKYSGSSPGGSVKIEATAGSITLGTDVSTLVNISAEGAGKGDVTLTAANAITVYGAIGTAQNGGTDATGNLTITSNTSGAIEITGTMKTASSLEGNITIEAAGDITLGTSSDDITAVGSGPSSGNTNGKVTIKNTTPSNTNTLTINGAIKSAQKSTADGSVLIENVGGAITITGGIDTYGSTGSGVGNVTITKGGAVEIGGIKTGTSASAGTGNVDIGTVTGGASAGTAAAITFTESVTTKGDVKLYHTGVLTLAQSYAIVAGGAFLQSGTPTGSPVNKIFGNITSVGDFTLNRATNIGEASSAVIFSTTGGDMTLDAIKSTSGSITAITLKGSNSKDLTLKGDIGGDGTTGGARFSSITTDNNSKFNNIILDNSVSMFAAASPGTIELNAVSELKEIYAGPPANKAKTLTLNGGAGAVFNILPPTIDVLEIVFKGGGTHGNGAGQHATNGAKFSTNTAGTIYPTKANITLLADAVVELATDIKVEVGGTLKMGANSVLWLNGKSFVIGDSTYVSTTAGFDIENGACVDGDFDPTSIIDISGNSGNFTGVLNVPANVRLGHLHFFENNGIPQLRLPDALTVLNIQGDMIFEGNTSPTTTKLQGNGKRITVGGNWTQTNWADFKPYEGIVMPTGTSTGTPAGEVEFVKNEIATPERTVLISGTTNWHNLTIRRPYLEFDPSRLSSAGETISGGIKELQFSNYANSPSTGIPFANSTHYLDGILFLEGTANTASERIVLTRQHNQAAQGTDETQVPANLPTNGYFWYFFNHPTIVAEDSYTDPTLDMRSKHYEVYHSWAQYAVTPIQDAENTGHHTLPYYYNGTDVSINSMHNVRWDNTNMFLYAFTEDSDGNGKLDRIRLQAFTINGPDNFGDFEAYVEGYDIDTDKGARDGNSAIVRGYQIVPYTPDGGLAPGTSGKTMMWIHLVEKDYPDTGVRPRWGIKTNTQLRAGSPEPLTASSIPICIDTAPPRVVYSLALPGGNQVYVRMSEPVLLDNAAIGNRGLSGLKNKQVNGIYIDDVTLVNPLAGEYTDEFVLTLASTINANAIINSVPINLDFLEDLQERPQLINGHPLPDDPTRGNNSSYDPLKYPRYPEYYVDQSAPAQCNYIQVNNQNLDQDFASGGLFGDNGTNHNIEMHTSLPNKFVSSANYRKRISDLLIMVPPEPNGAMPSTLAIWPESIRDGGEIVEDEDDTGGSLGRITHFTGTERLRLTPYSVNFIQNSSVTPSSFDLKTRVRAYFRSVSVFDGFHFQGNDAIVASNVLAHFSKTRGFLFPSDIGTGEWEQPRLLDNINYFLRPKYKTYVDNLSPPLITNLFPTFGPYINDAYPLKDFVFVISNPTNAASTNSKDGALFGVRLNVYGDGTSLAPYTLPNPWWETETAEGGGLIHKHLRPFSLLMREFVSQSSGVSILNNVINPEKGEYTVLNYNLKRAGRVTINVFTMDGRLVRTLISQHQTVLSNGYFIQWDGRNQAGRSVARGMYFIRIVGPDIDETRKVMVIK